MKAQLKEQIISAALIPIATLLGFLFGVYAVESTIINNIEYDRPTTLMYNLKSYEVKEIK